MTSFFTADQRRYCHEPRATTNLTPSPTAATSEIVAGDSPKFSDRLLSGQISAYWSSDHRRRLSDESTRTLASDFSRRNRHRRIPPPLPFSVFSGQFWQLTIAVSSVDPTITFTEMPPSFSNPWPVPPRHRLPELPRASTVAVIRISQPNSRHLQPSHRYGPCHRDNRRPIDRSRSSPAAGQPPPSIPASACLRRSGASDPIV